MFSNDLCIAVWNSYFLSIGKTPLPRDTGIFNDWRSQWMNGHYKGCCLSAEYPVTLPNGDPGAAQNYAGGTCVWDNKTHSPTWLVMKMVLAPLTHLSSAGEVAEFLDDNQFGFGESVMKCGPESISVFFHSVAPGQHNPHTSEEVHSMAHQDYVRFDEPLIGDVPKGGGTDNDAFYKMIESHGITYRILPPHDWSIIREWLRYGYPVIIGGVQESTIHDADPNGNPPYDWGDLENKWHIIMATGLGSRPDRLKFRDTANGRSGPREYFHEQMNSSLATLMVPNWMPEPPPNAVRPQNGGPEMFSNDLCVAVWNSYFLSIGKTPLPRDTGIFNDWRSQWMNGHYKGCCLSAEYSVTLPNGDPGAAQNYAGGTCVWNKKTNLATWL